MLQMLRRWTSRVKRRLSGVMWATVHGLIRVLSAIGLVGALVVFAIYWTCKTAYNAYVVVWNAWFHAYDVANRWIRLQMYMAKRRLR